MLNTDCWLWSNFINLNNNKSFIFLLLGAKYPIILSWELVPLTRVICIFMFYTITEICYLAEYLPSAITVWPNIGFWLNLPFDMFLVRNITIECPTFNCFYQICNLRLWTIFFNISFLIQFLNQIMSKYKVIEFSP